MQSYRTKSNKLATLLAVGMLALLPPMHKVYAADHNVPELILTDVTYIQMPQPFALYETPDFSSQVLERFAPQAVKVVQTTETGWLQVETYRGNYWVNPNEPIAPLVGKTVILDAGHGEGHNAYKGYSEGTNMLKLTKKVEARLIEQGARVRLIRETWADVLLITRPVIANLWSLEALQADRLKKLSEKTALETHSQGTETIDYTIAGPIIREEMAEDADQITSSDATWLQLESELAEIQMYIDLMKKIIENPSEYASIYLNTPYDWSYTRQIHPDLARIFELQQDPVISDYFLLISIHSNASSNTSARGADVYHMTNTISNMKNYSQGYTNADKTYRFGDTLLNNIAAVGIPRKAIIADNFAVIRETNLPAVLVENGFHTNDVERGLLSNDVFLDQLAMAYEQAVLAYFR